MQVKFDDTRYMYYTLDSTVEPLKCKDPVVIAIDPSKTNMAICIATPSRNIIKMLQFSDPGRANDTTTYCRKFKRFLKQYLANVEIFDAGIEAAISKRGMVHHHSSMVLTEIRAAMLDLFYEHFDVKIKEINNWSWKSKILPDGYRGQHEKGSTRYLPDLYLKYGSDDATDAICMMLYLTYDYWDTCPIEPKGIEAPVMNYNISLMPPMGTEAPVGFRFITYNPDISLRANAIYYVNRANNPGLAVVPKECLTESEILQYTPKGISLENTKEIWVVIVRS